MEGTAGLSGASRNESQLVVGWEHLRMGNPGESSEGALSPCPKQFLEKVDLYLKKITCTNSKFTLKHY